jgi:hypothetical protein
MGLDDGLGDGKAEPKAAESPRDPLIGLLKRIENPFDRLGLNTDPAIRDLDYQLPRRIAGTEPDRAIPRRELRRILKQIPNNLLEPRAIPVQPVTGGVQRESQELIFRLDIRP